MSTCPFPGCTEPPDTVTNMWAWLGSQLLLVAVKVCGDHKQMNEATVDNGRAHQS